MKLKFVTTVKERYQRLLNFITTDVLEIQQQNSSRQYIFTLPITPIIKSSFNKHVMSWELICHRLLHPSDSVMESMCLNQTLYGLTKHCPNKINKAPCTICYTEKNYNFPKGKNI